MTSELPGSRRRPWNPRPEAAGGTPDSGPVNPLAAHDGTEAGVPVALGAPGSEAPQFHSLSPSAPPLPAEQSSPQPGERPRGLRMFPRIPLRRRAPTEPQVPAHPQQAEEIFSRNSDEQHVLDKKLAYREEDILFMMTNSFRGLRHPEVVLLGNMAAEIRGKVVGDMGSGLGGLAKTAHIEGIDTTIWSINPHLRDPYYNNWQQNTDEMETFLRGDYPTVTDDQIQEAQRYHDEHVSTNFAHNLHDFPENFFDLLIDNWAVHLYMPEDEPLIYGATIDEMLRVTKPGGEIIVGDGGKVDFWRRGGMGKTALDKRNIPFEPIRSSIQEDGRRIFPGVTIFKPDA